MSLLQMTASRAAELTSKAAELIGRESWLVRRLRPAYETLLDRVSNDHGLPWQINGVTYRIDPRLRHQLSHDYDASVVRFLRTRVKPGAVCIDVGANVGVYVLQFAHWSGPEGRVIAFEPNPGARSVLEKHIQFNGLNGQAMVVPAAVGEAAGEAVLYAAGADGMSRLGAPNKLIAERVIQITVPIVTLDGFCIDKRIEPDWLFIDIEGFEIAALAGARQLIKSRGADLGIVVEMHPDVWTSANTTRERAEALLDELGRRAVPLTGQRNPLDDYGLVYLEAV